MILSLAPITSLVMDVSPRAEPTTRLGAPSGDKIMLLDGAFADCFGLYDGLKDSERVAILLNLLGRNLRRDQILP
jgi:hypothetical protein